MPGFFVDDVVAKRLGVEGEDVVFGKKSSARTVGQEKVTTGRGEYGAGTESASGAGVGNVSFLVTVFVDAGGKGDVCGQRSFVVGVGFDVSESDGVWETGEDRLNFCKYITVALERIFDRRSDAVGGAGNHALIIDVFMDGKSSEGDATEGTEGMDGTENIESTEKTEGLNTEGRCKGAARVGCEEGVWKGGGLDAVRVGGFEFVD